MVSLRGERTVQADDIARGEQLFHCGLPDVGTQLKRAFGGAGIYFHAESQGYACGSHAGMSESHDTHFLTGQFHEGRVPIAKVRIAAPTSLTVFFGIMFHAVGNGQQEGEDHLGYRTGTVCRDVANGNPVFAGSFDVYHVVARSQYADIFQIRQTVDVFGCDEGLVR